MEIRDGVWTSATKASDAEKIARIAVAICEETNEPETEKRARRIEDLARRLASDLRR